MEKYAIVKPERKDNPEGTHSKYFYPSAAGLQTSVIGYNRKIDDFLKEQLWKVEGSEADIVKFLSADRITEIADANVPALKESWSVERVMITNPEVVIKAIAALRVAGERLPKELDPEDPTPGIVKRKYC